MIQFRVLYSLDLLGTVTFAISGTLLAIEQQRKGYLASFLDFPRALLYAGLTALGGGTLRDLLLSRPIFWVRSPTYLSNALCTGSLTFLLFPEKSRPSEMSLCKYISSKGYTKSASLRSL